MFLKKARKNKGFFLEIHKKFSLHVLNVLTLFSVIDCDKENGKLLGCRQGLGQMVILGTLRYRMP
ncbi:hypothetical protein AT239_05535 [Bartonella henselae]|nr:hypothetical protein AT240_03590 [Bartonella henselae]OLL55868.1 hypothetical protein AT239_05535 [Bartonella henselae]